MIRTQNIPLKGKTYITPSERLAKCGPRSSLQLGQYPVNEYDRSIISRF